jgi:putative tricarboxylic transport membrane protein
MMEGEKYAPRLRLCRQTALLAALGGALALQVAAAAEPGWKPDKTIEIIATNAPGGGSDRIIRIMTKVMQQRRDLTVPIAIINKPGGGGSVSYAYLNQHPGDGHYLVLGSKAILTNNIAGRGPSFTELTPVAHLFNEYVSVTVRPDSPLKSGRDLVERLKQDPTALSFGIATSLGGPNHQAVAAALKEAGVDIRKMRKVIFPSGGAASTAMLGGHVDVVPVSAAFAASMLRNGQVRLLAVAAPKRLPGVLADVPTWREQGYDAVVSNWRLMVGPRGMTPAQIAYWESTFRRFGDSEDWRKELESNFWTHEFMGSTETTKFLERENSQARTFLVDLGLVK